MKSRIKVVLGVVALVVLVLLAFMYQVKHPMTAEQIQSLRLYNLIHSP